MLHLIKVSGDGCIAIHGLIVLFFSYGGRVSGYVTLDSSPEVEVCLQAGGDQACNRLLHRPLHQRFPQHPLNHHLLLCLLQQDSSLDLHRIYVTNFHGPLGKLLHHLLTCLILPHLHHSWSPHPNLGTNYHCYPQWWVLPS